MTEFDMPFPMMDLLCPRCDHREYVSDEDPDASLSMMHNHLARWHPSEDPLVLLGQVAGVRAR